MATRRGCLAYRQVAWLMLSVGVLLGACLPSNSVQLIGIDLKGMAAPNFHLLKTDGSPVALSDYRGKTVVLSFLSTDCEGLCAITAAKLYQVIQRLHPNERERVAFVEISVGPEGDSPTRVAQFLASTGLEGAVDYLTGRVEDLRSVRTAFSVPPLTDTSGVRYPGVTTLIDRRGNELVSMLDGDFAPEELVTNLRILDSRVG